MKIKFNQKLKMSDSVDAREQIKASNLYIRKDEKIIGKVTELFSLGKKLEAKIESELYAGVGELTNFILVKETDGWWLNVS